MPVGVEPGRSESGFGVELAAKSLYGFQNRPPVTSNISTLYAWNLWSTWLIVGIVAGFSANSADKASDEQLAVSTTWMIGLKEVRVVLLIFSNYLRALNSSIGQSTASSVFPARCFARAGCADY